MTEKPEALSQVGDKSRSESNLDYRGFFFVTPENQMGPRTTKIYFSTQGTSKVCKHVFNKVPTVLLPCGGIDKLSAKPSKAVDSPFHVPHASNKCR